MSEHSFKIIKISVAIFLFDKKYTINHYESKQIYINATFSIYYNCYQISSTLLPQSRFYFSTLQAGITSNWISFCESPSWCIEIIYHIQYLINHTSWSSEEKYPMNKRLIHSTILSCRQKHLNVGIQILFFIFDSRYTLVWKYFIYSFW